MSSRSIAATVADGAMSTDGVPEPESEAATGEPAPERRIRLLRRMGEISSKQAGPGSAPLHVAGVGSVPARCTGPTLLCASPAPLASPSGCWGAPLASHAAREAASAAAVAVAAALPSTGGDFPRKRRCEWVRVGHGPQPAVLHPRCAAGTASAGGGAPLTPRSAASGSEGGAGADAGGNMEGARGSAAGAAAAGASALGTLVSRGMTGLSSCTGEALA